MKEPIFYLNALVQQNTKELEVIYQQFFPKVKKFILQNKGQQQDAEDVFQKALLQLSVRYRKEKFNINTSFEAYLFTVCKNLWRRELNKSKYKVTINEVKELEYDFKDQALALLEQKRWELFTESLSLISENCQKILKYFFNKVPYSEIVKQMNYNSEMVARQRVFKCKAALTRVVQKDNRFQSLKEL